MMLPQEIIHRTIIGITALAAMNVEFRYNSQSHTIPPQINKQIRNPQTAPNYSKGQALCYRACIRI